MDTGDSPNQPPNRTLFQLDTVERMLAAEFPDEAPALIALLRRRTHDGVDDPLLSYLSLTFGRYFAVDVNNVVIGNLLQLVNDNVVQEVEASEDQQPEGSRRRPQEEEEDEDQETGRERIRWWDEFNDSDSGDEEDAVPVYQRFSQTDNDADDPPGTSRKRTREDDEDVDAQENKHCRLWKKRERQDDEDDDAGSPKHLRLK